MKPVTPWASLLALFVFALPACDATIEHTETAEPAEVRGFPEQSLKIEREGGADTLRVWIADTPERQQQGLMFVRSMPRDRGMLFPQTRPRPMTMWMKNTYIPLDMVWIGEDDFVIGVSERTEPLSEALVTSPGPITAVLEINAGEAARRGIARGQRIVATGTRQNP